MFAARAGGCWNLFPLSDPKERSFGEGLLGTPQKTSVLQGVSEGAQLSLPTTGKGWEEVPSGSWLPSPAVILFCIPDF